ncbi:MAG TPA: acyltransferase family protein [Steroidobacteraceae bacterium]|nr:acyltransferase family protein [Steroidobacteraceae bacterium]
MNTLTPPAGSTRYDFLDWLRVIAIFVLLFFHTGMMFVGWGWHIQNAETITALQLPMDIAHRLRMPLLFVIAGAGMWFALGNRNGAGLVRERSVRLLLPLVAGMFLIVPPQIYFERLFRGQWDGGYFSFFFERVLQLKPYPQGDFSWHHLWFVAYLYVYVFLLLPLLLWWRAAKKVVKPGAWLYALGLPLAINEAILKPLYPESHKLIGDWYIFNHYFLLTLYGGLLASLRGAWDWFAARRQLSLGLALVVFGVAMLLFQTNVIQRDTAADAFVANIFTWASLMAFIGYGRRYLSFSNPLLRWARDASYPIYILHQTVIITIGYWIIQQPWNPWTKYAAVLVGTMSICVALYEGIRRFQLTRLAFGMKISRKPPAGAGSPPSPVVARARIADDIA